MMSLRKKSLYTLLTIFWCLGVLVGCASWVTGKPAVKPEGPGQVGVSAYATIDKTYIAVKYAAAAKAASPDDLQAVLNDAKTARALLDGAQGSLAAGDLSTTIGKLQAAQALLDGLSKFLAAHPVPAGAQ